MYYIEFDATPYLRGFWVGTGHVYRHSPDKYCFKRRSKEQAEKIAKYFGYNAKVVYKEDCQ